MLSPCSGSDGQNGLIVNVTFVLIDKNCYEAKKTDLEKRHVTLIGLFVVVVVLFFFKITLPCHLNGSVRSDRSGVVLRVRVLRFDED